MITVNIIDADTDNTIRSGMPEHCAIMRIGELIELWTEHDSAAFKQTWQIVRKRWKILGCTLTGCSIYCECIETVRIPA